MVALKNKAVASRQDVANMRCDFADVSQHTEAAGSIGKDILHRLTCIVRHGKRLHFKVTDLQRPVAIDDMEIKPGVRFLAGGPSAMCNPDRRGVFTGKTKNATDVIAVFMGDEDAGNICWLMC